MALKNYNPTTPSRRALVPVDKSEIYKGKPLKKKQIHRKMLLD